MKIIVSDIINLIQTSTVRRAPRAPFAPRFLSTVPTEPVNPTELGKLESNTELIPDTSFVSDGAEASTGLASQIPPLHYGDLAALDLVSWTPAGLIRWSFEIINVSTGIPWFWTIVAGTLFWRVACLPFSILSLRESAKMQPLAKKMGDLRQAMTNSASGSEIDRARASAEYRAFNHEHDLQPLRAMYGIIQLPVTLGLFFGVQKLTTLPVAQLTQSGVAFLQDLTVPDPTYILPAALLALINVQINVRAPLPSLRARRADPPQVGAKDMDLAGRPEMGHIMNGLRVLSVAGFFVMSNFTTVRLSPSPRRVPR